MAQLKTSDFVPGRIYSVVYATDVDMVKTREFTVQDIRSNRNLRSLVPAELVGTFDSLPTAAIVKLENPLADCLVTVRRVCSVQAAGEKTWRNWNLRRDPAWQPSGRKSWYRVSAENSCIVEHNTNGTRYLRGLPKGVSKEQYFIGGIEANQDQASLIEAFKKNSGGEFVVLKIENLANVIETNADEDESK